MRGVFLEVPPSVIEERRITGADRFDEMWDGVLHMVPPPSQGHMELEGQLFALLLPVAKSLGLACTPETGLFDPDSAEPSWRVPDIAVYERRYIVHRGIEGPLVLGVEIHSPGDETDDKFPFYEHMGVETLLVVDRDTKEPTVFSLVDDRLVVQDADVEGWLPLGSLPVAVRADAGALVVRTADGLTSI